MHFAVNVISTDSLLVTYTREMQENNNEKKKSYMHSTAAVALTNR